MDAGRYLPRVVGVAVSAVGLAIGYAAFDYAKTNAPIGKQAPTVQSSPATSISPVSRLYAATPRLEQKLAESSIPEHKEAYDQWKFVRLGLLAYFVFWGGPLFYYFLKSSHEKKNNSSGNP
jgi:hypothetical protein